MLQYYYSKESTSFQFHLVSPQTYKSLIQDSDSAFLTVNSQGDADGGRPDQIPSVTNVDPLVVWRHLADGQEFVLSDHPLFGQDPVLLAPDHLGIGVAGHFAQKLHALTRRSRHVFRFTQNLRFHCK